MNNFDENNKIDEENIMPSENNDENIFEEGVELDDVQDTELDLDEEYIEEESEDESLSSDYSDYSETSYNDYSNNNFQNQRLQNNLRNLRNSKNNENVPEKLKEDKSQKLNKNLSNSTENVSDSIKEKASSGLKESGEGLAKNGVNKAAKGLSAGGTKAAAGAAAEGTTAAAGAAAEGAATGLSALVANPYFWIVVGIIAVILLLILVVIMWTAYDGDDADNDYLSNSNGSCNYVLNGEEIKSLKVRLLECDGKSAIAGEELVDFEKYVLGVTYAEHENGITESWKVQAIAAKSYALRRPDKMGNNPVKFTEENGQKILNIRNCTNDQVYCDPDKGCWSNSKTAGNTVYSGYQKGKAWSKPILADNSEIRTAVADVNDKILVGSDNNIYYATYINTNQNNWKNLANKGKNYNDILTSEYKNSKVTTISCSSSDDTNGGNCTTSTPIKIASNENFIISSKFGKRVAPTKGASTTHNGIDLAYTLGTPVYSVFDGKVTVAQDSYGSAGKAVLIGHDLDGDGKNDYYTEYFHLSKYNVKVGDTVTGGQKIGEIGSTGASTGPHLHFGIKKGDGTYIDPEPIVNDLKTKKSIFDKASVCKNNTSKKFNGVFPYYNQCNDSWKNHKICDSADYSGGKCVSSNTICSSGCGYTSFAMIASGFNNDSNIKPDNVVDFVAKFSYNEKGGALADDALTNKNVLNKYNLNAEVLFARKQNMSIKDKKQKIVKALESGKAVELLVPGHFVALVNINDGKILLNDPGKSANVGKYTIDELHSLFKKQRCAACSDTEIFVLAVAYSKK